MKKILIIIILLCFSTASSIHASIINIPADYSTIQEGINVALSHDIIMVAGGTYKENIVINKDIELMGADTDTTIIDGSGTGTVVSIGSAGVTVGYFTIINSGSGTEDAGIKIACADNCIIEHCKCVSNYAGLDLFGSGFNHLKNSELSGNYVGVRFRESDPCMSKSNRDNVIESNIIAQNDYCGIQFEHTGLVHHFSNIIKLNMIRNNFWIFFSHFF